MFVSIKTFLTFEIPIAAVTMNPRYDGTVRKTTAFTRVGTQMISLITVCYLASMTVHTTSKKAGHSRNNIIMVIVEIQVNSFLLLGTRIKNGILMLFGNDVDLVVRKIGLKLFDFIHPTRSEENARFFVQFVLSVFAWTVDDQLCFYTGYRYQSWLWRRQGLWLNTIHPCLNANNRSFSR
jgi:hypothetical protein